MKKKTIKLRLLYIIRYTQKKNEYFRCLRSAATNQLIIYTLKIVYEMEMKTSFHKILKQQ